VQSYEKKRRKPKDNSFYRFFSQKICFSPQNVVSLHPVMKMQEVIKRFQATSFHVTDDR
jgi:hypothetical protein